VKAAFEESKKEVEFVRRSTQVSRFQDSAVPTEHALVSAFPSFDSLQCLLDTHALPTCLFATKPSAIPRRVAGMPPMAQQSPSRPLGALAQGLSHRIAD
jgi:hypothetical protein